MIPDRPFAPVGTRESFLETVAGGALLLRLDDGLGAREPFLLLTGEPGTGKTTLVREAIARWDARVTAACLAYSALSGAELLEEIARRFGAEAPAAASRPALVACLERALAGIAGDGRVAMLVVDDAHGLPPELLEDLRLLVNAAQQGGWPLEVLLVGLPALEATLDSPALAALRQRVSLRARLEPLPAGECRRYLRHRVTAAGGDGSSLFPRNACNEIAALANGVPRRLNALASESLRLAQAAGAAAVQPEHVRAAAEALWGGLPHRAAAEIEKEEAPRAIPTPSRAGGDAKRSTPAPSPPATPLAPPRADAPAPRTEAAPVAAPRSEVAPPRRMPETRPPLAEPESFAPPAPPTHHDPGEWVARFVGDRGPVRIGSQAVTHFGATRAPREPLAEGAPPTAELAARPGAPAARRRRGTGPRAAAYAVLAIAAVVTAGLVVLRAKGPAGAKGTRATAAVEPAGPAGAAQARGAAPRAARAASSASPLAVAGRKDAGASAGAEARAATQPLVSPTGRWTLQVGEALDLQAALDQRDHAEQLTGFEGWVLPAPDGSSSPHRVVVGIYRSHARAAAAAKMLLSTRTLPAVSVVPLPKRSDRR